MYSCLLCHRVIGHSVWVYFWAFYPVPLILPGYPVHRDSPGKNTGVGGHFLLGDLPDPRIEPMSLMSPALVGGFFTTTSTWEALVSWSAQVNILFHKMVQRHQWINNESKSDFRICMILEMTIINVVWIIHEYTGMSKWKNCQYKA